MRYYFHSAPDKTPACSSESAGIHFTFANDLSYPNRDYHFRGDAFLFDGYSHWFRGPVKLYEDTETFSISAAFMPITFSSHADGIVSCYDAITHRGIEVFVERGGLVTVNMGHTIFSGIRARVHAGIWNVITVVYRGYAGWCDLYINGVFAARKQFPRHTRLTFPDTGMYFGRRMDGIRFKESLPFSCFYGYMRWVELDDKAPSEDEILALHASVYTGIPDQAAFAAAMPLRSTYAADPNHPAFHLCPAGKWMNEPHGPMYYNGWYHIFYQANPHAPIWDHLCWGHLRSRDMVHWEDCPLALIPEKEPAAPHGCWSGSSVIGKDGIPRIYFTAGDDNRFPNQAIALALPDDSTDPMLARWHSLPRLVQEQDMGWMGEFRDPFVWLEDDTYFMLVGSGDPNNGGGNAILYSSTDGMAWTNHGFIMEYDYEKNQELGHVWELPVMLPLRDESGQVVCHILLLCACQIEGDIVETYYFVGKWDRNSCHFTPLHERAGLLDLSRGIFTGPSGLVTPDNRSVVFTIAQGKRKFMDEIRAGWAHNGGMPVELSIRNRHLHIQPVQELETIRGEIRVFYDASLEIIAKEMKSGDVRCEDVISENVKSEEGSPGDGSSGEEISGNGSSGNGSSEQLNASLAENAASMACLEYQAGGDRASVILCFGSHYHKVTYDRATRRLTIDNETQTDVGRYRGSVDEVDIQDEAISFLCYLDHSMLEIYVNGRKAITLRNYTDEKRYFQVEGRIQSLKLWDIAL